MKLYYIESVWVDNDQNETKDDFVSAETAEQACALWYAKNFEPWTITQLIALPPPAEIATVHRQSDFIVCEPAPRADEESA